MAKPAQAALNQIKENHPDAVVVSREKNSITASIGSNKSALVSSIGAMHYEDNGWQEIDTTWNPTTGAWQYEMTTAPYQASARDSFNVGEVVEYRTREGQWVRFQPLALNWRDSNNQQEQIAIPQAVATTVVEDKLSWPNAYGSGRHFDWIAHPTRLQKLLTVDSALPVPAAWLGTGIELELTFAFTYDSTVTAYIDGVAWDKSTRVVTGNAVEFRAGTTTLWHFTTPKSWDSSAEIQEASGQLSFYKVGNTLHVAVRFPKSFIDSAVYPIYLDPTIDQDVSLGGDDYHATPTTFGDVYTRLQVGAYWYSATSTHAVWSAGFLFKNITLPTWATVTTAEFRVRIAGWSSDPNETGRVHLEYSDNPLIPTSASDWESRTRTSSSVSFFRSGSSPQVSDISTQLSEVFNLSGWASGNNLHVLLDNSVDISGFADFQQQYTTLVSYESPDLIYLPNIYIEYTEGDPFTLTPDGTVSSSGIVDQAAGTTNLHLAVDETTADNDTTYLVNSADASGEVVFTLSDTPSDFDTLYTLSITIRARIE